MMREDNYPLISRNGSWRDLFFPIFCDVPAASEEYTQSDVEQEIVKWALNIHLNIVNYLFKNQANMVNELNALFDAFAAFSGWTPSSVDRSRWILGKIIVKVSGIGGRKKAAWVQDFERVEWNQLFQVLSIVEDFMFYRPSGPPGRVSLCMVLVVGASSPARQECLSILILTCRSGALGMFVHPILSVDCRRCFVSVWGVCECVGCL